MELDSRYTKLSDETSFTGDPQAVQYLPPSLKEVAKRAVDVGVNNAKMTVIAPDKDLTWQEGIKLAKKAERADQLEPGDLMSKLQQSYVGKLERMTERGAGVEEFPAKKKEMSGLGADPMAALQTGAQLATAAATGLTAATNVLNQNKQQAAPAPVVQEEPKILGIIPVKWALLGAGLAVAGLVIMRNKKEAPAGVLPVVAAKKKRRKK